MHCLDSFRKSFLRCAFGSAEGGSDNKVTRLLHVIERRTPSFASANLGKVMNIADLQCYRAWCTQLGSGAWLRRGLFHPGSVRRSNPACVALCRSEADVSAHAEARLLVQTGVSSQYFQWGLNARKRQILGCVLYSGAICTDRDAMEAQSDNALASYSWMHRLFSRPF